MNDRLPDRPRAVLFDWDNTLVDTWPAIHDSLNTTFEAMGHALWTIEETRARVRRSLRETFPEMFGERWQEARSIFYERFRAIHIERLDARPGAEEILVTLKGLGVYLGVVSNKAGEHLRAEANHLGWDRYFSRLVGATDAERDKPDVVVVELALEGSKVRRGRDVWFVGDTEIDMECASNAGCISVLIRSTSLEDGEFSQFHPDMHFFDCNALLALVEKL